MNRALFVVLLALMMVSGVAANAGTYTFTPSVPDLNDLPHGNYYTWGIKWGLPSAVVSGDEIITGATFTYISIDDTENDVNSKLYTHLLSARL